MNKRAKQTQDEDQVDSASLQQDISAGDQDTTEDKRNGSDRRDNADDQRSGMDRRCDLSTYDGPERRRQDDEDRRNGWDRRRGPGRRRSDDRRSAEEGEMTDDQFELIKAIDEYKRVNKRPFPSYTEVLEIVKALGYRKVAQPQPLKPLQQ